MNDRNLVDDDLEQIALDIEKHENASDVELIKAAKLLHKTKQKFCDGEYTSTNWDDWSQKRLQLKATRIRELLRIGAADNPAEELMRKRRLNADRQRKHRDAQKQKGVEKSNNTVNGRQAVRDAENDGVEPEVSAADSRTVIAVSNDAVNAAAPAPQAVISASVDDQREANKQQLLTWAEAASADEIRVVLDFIASRKTKSAAPNGDFETPSVAAA
ncbi:MAG: hypothetical protein AAF224_03325 [Pseudomonadota bacterium]